MKYLVPILILAIGLMPYAFGQKTYFSNCKAMNKVYPHGVGRVGATDKTKNDKGPVTNFVANTALYQAITKQNANLDRDGDGIACERH